MSQESGRNGVWGRAALIAALVILCTVAGTIGWIGGVGRPGPTLVCSDGTRFRVVCITYGSEHRAAGGNVMSRLLGTFYPATVARGVGSPTVEATTEHPAAVVWTEIESPGTRPISSRRSLVNWWGWIVSQGGRAGELTPIYHAATGPRTLMVAWNVPSLPPPSGPFRLRFGVMGGAGSPQGELIVAGTAQSMAPRRATPQPLLPSAAHPAGGSVLLTRWEVAPPLRSRRPDESWVGTASHRLSIRCTESVSSDWAPGRVEIVSESGNFRVEGRCPIPTAPGGAAWGGDVQREPTLTLLSAVPLWPGERAYRVRCQFYRVRTRSAADADEVHTFAGVSEWQAPPRYRFPVAQGGGEVRPVLAASVVSGTAPPGSRGGLLWLSTKNERLGLCVLEVRDTAGRRVPFRPDNSDYDLQPAGPSGSLGPFTPPLSIRWGVYKPCTVEWAVTRPEGLEW